MVFAIVQKMLQPTGFNFTFFVWPVLCLAQEAEYIINVFLFLELPSSSPHACPPVRKRSQPGLFFLPEIQVRLIHHRPSCVRFFAVLYPRSGAEPDSPKPILTRDYLRSIYPGSPQPLANRKKGISRD